MTQHRELIRLAEPEMRTAANGYVRCPACGRLLFQAQGTGTVINVKCKCHRMVTRHANGSLTTTDLVVSDIGQRRTA